MSDYNTLLAAIHALDPFENTFCTTNPAEHAVQCEPFLLVCDYCNAESNPDDKIKHTPECPVAHLRNILNDADLDFKAVELPSPAICEGGCAEKTSKDMVIWLQEEYGSEFDFSILAAPIRVMLNNFKSSDGIKSPTDNGV